MKLNFINLVFTFCLFSILGYLLEVSFRSIRDRRFVNPGLLKGPYLMLYGAAGIILSGAVTLLHPVSWIVKVPVYFFITTGLELGSGFLAQRLFHATLWDYSDQRFNYKGHICLKFSLIWICLAFVFEYALYPVYLHLFMHIPPRLIQMSGLTVFTVMFLDFLVTSFHRLLRFSPEQTARFREEFDVLARPLLNDPRVSALARYPHHRGKTRLDHVKEVAYISFLIGKRFSLDCRSIVIGGLLHDLFYYDWLHEGPRLHGFRHHTIALNNARKVTELSDRAADIIKKHMWPLTVIPPRYPESLAVSLVDTFCSTRDYFSTRSITPREAPLKGENKIEQHGK